MRLARKLFLLAITAMAFLALTASAASAQVEILDEPTGDHCGDVELDAATYHIPEGGCEIHVNSEAPGIYLAQHVGGVEGVVSLCTNEFDAKISESGDGYIYDVVLGQPNPAAPTCFVTPCDEEDSTDEPWAFHSQEFGPQESISPTFCVRSVAGEPGHGPIPCTVQVTVTGTHDYEFATNSPGVPVAPNTGTRCSNNAVVSLAGVWHLEGTPIEIVH